MVDTVFFDSVTPVYCKNKTFGNLLGIIDSKELSKIEANITAIRSIELFQDKDLIPQTFGFDHLKAIHFHLFQDIYSWAGKPRAYDMKKGDDTFTPANLLPRYESEVFTRSIDYFNREQRPSISESSELLASCLGIINIYHPFPEGNGRAQRIFLSSLAGVFEYSLSWGVLVPGEIIGPLKNIHQEQNYKPLENQIRRIISDES